MSAPLEADGGAPFVDLSQLDPVEQARIRAMVAERMYLDLMKKYEVMNAKLVEAGGAQMPPAMPLPMEDMGLEGLNLGRNFAARNALPAQSDPSVSSAPFTAPESATVQRQSIDQGTNPRVALESPYATAGEVMAQVKPTLPATESPYAKPFAHAISASSSATGAAFATKQPSEAAPAAVRADDIPDSSMQSAQPNAAASGPPSSTSAPSTRSSGEFGSSRRMSLSVADARKSPVPQLRRHSHSVPAGTAVPDVGRLSPTPSVRRESLAASSSSSMNNDPHARPPISPRPVASSRDSSDYDTSDEEHYVPISSPRKTSVESTAGHPGGAGAVDASPRISPQELPIVSPRRESVGVSASVSPSSMRRPSSNDTHALTHQPASTSPSLRRVSLDGPGSYAAQRRGSSPTAVQLSSTGLAQQQVPSTPRGDRSTSDTPPPPSIIGVRSPGDALPAPPPSRSQLAPTYEADVPPVTSPRPVMLSAHDQQLLQQMNGDFYATAVPAATIKAAGNGIGYTSSSTQHSHAHLSHAISVPVGVPVEKLHGKRMFRSNSDPNVADEDDGLGALPTSTSREKETRRVSMELLFNRPRQTRQLTPVAPKRTVQSLPSSASYVPSPMRKEAVHNRRGKLIKSWVERVLELNRESLTVLIEKKKGVLEPEFAIDLDEISQVATCEDDTYDSCFFVFVAGKSRTFRTSTKENARLWVESIATLGLNKAVRSASNLGRLSLFLDQGALVNAIDCVENIPMVAQAVASNHLQEAHILINRGAHAHYLVRDNFLSKVPFDRVFSFMMANTKIDPNIVSNDDIGNTLMHVAARLGKTEAVMELLRRRVEVNHPNRLGDAPLHVAIKCDMRPVAIAVLRSGLADVNVPAKDGNLPIHLALMRNQEDVVKELETRGADINKPDSEKYPPVHYALKSANVPMATFFVNRGADVDAVNGDGDQPLHVALRAGPQFVALCGTLVNKGASLHVTDHHGRTPFHYAMEAGKGAQQLIRRMAEIDTALGGVGINVPDRRGETALMMAARQRDAGLFQYLLEHRANPNMQNDRGETAVHVIIDSRVENKAASASEEAAVCELISACVKEGLDLSLRTKETGDSLLHLTVKHGLVGVARHLLSLHPALLSQQNVANNQPLHLAAFFGSVSMMELLLSAGADRDALNGRHETPLHMAVRGQQLPMTEYLLSIGCNPHHWDCNGNFPLHSAIEFNLVDFVRHFIAYGVDINARTESFLTPLMLAVDNDAPNIVSLLLVAGANATHRMPGNRYTCLHHAVSRTLSACAQAIVLKSNGKIALLVDKDGKTALDICRDPSVSSLLRMAISQA
eukprot:Opistho-2@90369